MTENQVTPEQEQKWRKEFEFWASDEGSDVKAIEKGIGGAYRLLQTHMFWLSFKVARAIDAHRIAELEAQVVAMQWQPIETAPKDGTRILLYRPLAERTHDEQIDIRRGIPRDSGCWDETIPEGLTSENYTDGYCKATHWMPLPDAPTPAAKSKGK